MTTHPVIPMLRSPNRVRSGPTEQVAVAFLARVSTNDQQDPTLSLPRQLANGEAALPDGWQITAWFGTSSPAAWH